jgi:hypothetical protein
VDVGGGHEPENANLCPANYPSCQRLGPLDPGYLGPVNYFIEFRSI